ncbi:MAG: hypothetical protein MJ101_07000 [Clostridia bacterium]|nr:hypothetical protein [Clostridia bacterium]
MYVDCPGYEQNVWVGDAGITALVNMVNFGKGAFDAEYLRTIGLSMNDGLERFYRTGNPRYVAKKYLPCSCFPTYPEGGIPIWSYTYVMQVMDHYLYFGADEYIDDFVADIDLCLRRSIELTDDRGLLSVDGAWNLIEWADNDLDMCGEVTANNCMLAACFARASDFVSSLGMSERANEYAAYAEKYRVSVNKYCYDEKEGAYVDTVRDEYTYRHYLDVYAQKGRIPLKYDEYLAHSRISVQTNTFAVLYGCADGERRDNALKIVKTAVDKGGFVIGTPANVTADKSLYGAGRAVTIGTPFFLYYAIDCLIKCGEFDLAVKSVKRDWGVFLDDGFDTCLEGFRTRSGELARSASHAWGASPAVFLMRDILGIRPTKAGYGEFTVTPHLGDLKFAQGSVPTPYGPISVRCTKTDSGTDISVEAPDKCKYVR